MVVRADVVKPLDLSGQATTNLISDEQHSFALQTARPFVVPHFGAFFKESLIVINDDTGVEVPATDYICMDLYENATYRSGAAVFNTIFFPTKPAGSVTITYQCLGGEYSHNRAGLIEWLAERSAVTGAGDFNDLVDVPRQFTPAHHQFHIRDIYGMEYIVQALDRLDQAVDVGNDPAWRATVAQLKAKLEAARIAAMTTTTDTLLEHTAWFSPTSTKSHIGLGILEDLSAMSRGKARTVIEPTYNRALDATSHMLTIDSLDAAGEGLFQNLVSRVDTNLDRIEAVIQPPHRSTLLSMVVGAVITFPTKQKLYEDNGFYDFEVYPPDTALDATIHVTRVNMHVNNYGGLWMAHNETTATTWICTLRTDACDQRFKWQRILVAGDLDNFLKSVLEHIDDTKNPHELDREDIELGKIENLPVITEDEILNEESIRKYLTLDTLMYFAKMKLSGVKPPPPPGTEVDPDAPTMDQAQIIFTPCKDKTGGTGGREFPTKGQLIKTFCDGTDRFARYTDGAGGFYDEVLQLNSDDCGYVEKPRQGTLLSEKCVGLNKVGVYADGNGGKYEEAIENNSTDCGYVAPPPQGTVLSQFCQGVNQYTRYANGSGGYTDQMTKQNAPECGYVAPTAPPPSHVPAGTLMNERCVGVDKVGTYANGNGGTYDSVIRANDPSCGYVAPTTAPPATSATPAPVALRTTLNTNKQVYAVGETITMNLSTVGATPGGLYTYTFERKYQTWPDFYGVDDISGVVNHQGNASASGTITFAKSWIYVAPELNSPGSYQLRMKVTAPDGSTHNSTVASIQLLG